MLVKRVASNSQAVPMDALEKVRELFNRVSYLTQEEKSFILEKTIIEKFSKGTVLLRQGQVPTKCFTVLEGCVREYTMSKGEEICVMRHYNAVDRDHQQ